MSWPTRTQTAIIVTLAAWALCNPLGVGQRLARLHPGWAAYTSIFPTFFNFEHRYESGTVFHFPIGQEVDFSALPNGMRAACTLAQGGRLIPVPVSNRNVRIEERELLFRCREAGVTFNLILELSNRDQIEVVRLATGVWA